MGRPLGRRLMSKSLVRRLSLLCLLSAISLGCGDATLTASPDATTAPSATESGPAPDLALLVKPPNASISDVGTGGTLIVEGGCTYRDGPVGQRTVIVWPHGTTWNAQESAVERSGGIAPFNDPPFKLRSGDYFQAGGYDIPMSQAFGSLAPGSDEVLERCAESEGGVVLLWAGVGIVSPPPSVPPTSSFEQSPTS